MEPLTFNISTNKYYHKHRNKKKRDIHPQVVENWEMMEHPWTEEHLIKLTTTQGLCGADLLDGIKGDSIKTGFHYRGTYCLFFDLEKGWNTTEVREEQKTWDFNSYLHSSLSHKQSDPRFHVIVPLAEPIVQKNILQKIKKHFISLFGSNIDSSSFDRVRYFTHGTDKVTSFIDNKGFLDPNELLITIEAAEEEAEDSDVGETKKTSKQKKATKKTIKEKKEEEVATRVPLNERTYRLRQAVTKTDMTETIIWNLEPDDEIFCPFCGFEDTRGNKGVSNAVYYYSATNPDELIIFCHSCEDNKKGHSRRGVYELHPDDKYILKAIETGELVFADIKTSKFCSVGFYHGDGDRPTLSTEISSEYKKNFLKARETEMPIAFPEMRLETSFDYKETIDFDKYLVNKYYPTDYLNNKIPEHYIAKLPDYTNKVITHLFGNDVEIQSLFLNDLANFIQTRQKMITAYLVSGTQGTGKGLFFGHVIAPMVGKDFCYSDSLDAFGKEFNTHLSNTLFMLLNEVTVDFISDSKKDKVRNRLKMAIADIEVGGEGKGKDRGKSKNICSFMLATNSRFSIQLEENDRRFNVSAWQDEHIFDQDWYLGDAASEVRLEEELQEFTWWLQQYKVDKTKVNRVISNAPKRALQALSKTNEEDFFQAIHDGDFDWLLDNSVEGTGYNHQEIHREMESKINLIGSNTKVLMSSLCEIYNYTNKKSITTIGFGKLATKNNIVSFRSKDGFGKKVTFCKIEWQKS